VDKQTNLKKKGGGKNMKKVGKNLVLFFAIGAIMVSIYSGLSTAAIPDTKTVITSVKVDTLSGLTLYEADGVTKINNASTRDFSKNYDGPYTPKPNDTSWKDTDNWTVENPNLGKESEPAPSRITAVCVHNGNTGIFYLKIKVDHELQSGTEKIPFTFDAGGKTYAYYGWTATAPGEEGTVNEHKYAHGGMLPYSKTDEIAYTSINAETGAKVSVWTGIQVPFDQKSQLVTPYTSTVTYTLTN
jgi:hypothetical protein